MFAGGKGEKFTKDFAKSDFLKYQNLSFFKAISEHLVQRLKKKYFFPKIFSEKNIFFGIVGPNALKWL